MALVNTFCRTVAVNCLDILLGSHCVLRRHFVGHSTVNNADFFGRFTVNYLNTLSGATQ